jgi:rhamnose transport system permease protein
MTTLTDAPRVRTYRAHARPAWRRILLTREMAIIALLLLVIGVALASVRNFDSPLTVTYLLRDVAPILLIALPMTLIIITEEIDLSVASIVGLSSVVTGLLTQAGLPFPAAALVAILVGTLGGVFNGFLVTVVGLPSLAVTIGTLALFRGIAVGLLGTTAITDFPEEWTDLAKANIPGTPVPVITINRALPILGVQDFWQQAVVGALILGAIVLDRVLAARRSRKLVEARDAS